MLNRSSEKDLIRALKKPLWDDLFENRPFETIAYMGWRPSGFVVRIDGVVHVDQNMVKYILSQGWTLKEFRNTVRKIYLNDGR